MPENSDQLLKPEIVVVCQNIRSLFNVGSIFRTSDCFGVGKVILTGITGRPPRKEIAKVALGAENYIPWEYVRFPLKAVKKLKAEGYTIVALEQHPGRSVPLSTYLPTFPIAILLGYEVKGLPKPLLEASDVIVEIEQYGQKESLNVSVAFGIAANHMANYLKAIKIPTAVD